ncbi:cytokinin riboside 5'-monophosphate phosphoribohydrolase LOG1-like isoform X3 [Phaseolus vulgaris]|uniref:cytokinin riboside 5'-monophosphate phosphoribohydrolase LOG1-like isoform X3 n=1 Tax=Phaseolus vulgaris TaxID=3885 RepID=UPI0035CB18E9
MHQRKAEMAKHSDAFIALPDYNCGSNNLFFGIMEIQTCGKPILESYSNSRKRSRTSDEEKGYKAICGPEDKKLLKFEGNEDYEDNLEEE